MNCADCSNAWRVLGADGRPSPGFAWSDPERKDTQQDALEAEGVPFICDHADSRSRLPREQLTAMLDA
jgi:alkylated DNA nucleotide flippase Atl1